MKTEEKTVFKQLCNFQSDKLDPDLLQYASPELLGHLFLNRMQAIAYGVLKKHACLGAVNREFRSCLKGAYEQNIQSQQSFLCGLNELSRVLEPYRDRYAMVKGAVLGGIYPKGYRTSHDVDLLVLPQDVTVIGDALEDVGFRQGSIRNGAFVPASRPEIIASRMLRGETVPYIMEVDLPFMQFLEVDLNFSLDYKQGDVSTLKAMLEQTMDTERGDVRITTLRQEDFLLHLCCHLYKEATTLPWVTMKRDMTLYKYADLYLLLNNRNETNDRELFSRAQELELEKPCAFAILQTAELFDVKNDWATGAAKEILREEPDFLHTVISPGEKKTYVYKTRDLETRFFMNDRVSDLEEVTTI